MRKDLFNSNSFTCNPALPLRALTIILERKITVLATRRVTYLAIGRVSREEQRRSRPYGAKGFLDD